ncbi:MAG: DUF2139 domain-containing protein [Desulfurococcaceae archaeon]
MEWFYRPRWGPEWGSGGAFGLTYYHGVLYYTLSMEAEAHFIHDSSDEVVYKFELVGPGPASGGDTYNAVEVVDNYIYFGGWVHAPAVFKGKRGFISEIDFRNKYSHVHEYDIYEKRVRLVWSESIHHEYEWAGEVSVIIHDRVNDELLIGRADGHRNLGVYRVERRSGKSTLVTTTPALKGALFLEYLCFDMQPNWLRGIDGVQCYDPYSKRVIEQPVSNWEEVSVDGYGVEHRFSGYAISAYTRYWDFFRGGVLVGNPLEPEISPLQFIRLFDFGENPYGPLRSNALELGGGVLAVFNSYTHGYLHARGENPEEKSKALLYNYIAGPTVLVYITPPVARIVMVLGARVTSMTKMRDKILLGTNTAPNLGGLDATPVDVGVKSIIAVPEHALLTARSPPLVFKVSGLAVRNRMFGGIPLTGYREPELRIHASKVNKLTIVEYDIGLPASKLDTYTQSIREGLNKIDLSSFKHIVSFKLEQLDDKAVIEVVLT